jgi:hypothetical protein
LLPMASAILTVLWPDEFSVYDRRVCEQLNDFEWVANRVPRRTWDGYMAFRDAVVAAAPSHLSLRDKDRYLWGRSNAEQLEKDLEREWPNKALHATATTDALGTREAVRSGRGG